MKISNLPDFDMAKMLKTDEDIANYLTLVLEENNEAELIHALGVIARARGTTSKHQLDAEEQDLLDAYENEDFQSDLTESRINMLKQITLDSTKKSG